MKKKIITAFLILAFLVLLWFCGIRIYMPFSSITPKEWNVVKMTNPGKGWVSVTDPEDIAKVKELFRSYRVTTIGMGSDKDGIGLIMWINSDKYIFQGNDVMKKWKYRISGGMDYDSVYKLYDEFSTKYGTKEEP